MTCRRSLVRSQPRAPSGTKSCSSSRPGNRALNPATRVRLPYTTLSPKTPSSNGSGSEITNLRMAVRVRPESRRIGPDPGSGWFPTPTSGVRLLGGLRARQAAHLVVKSVSYAGRAGFDPLACHDDPSGDSSGRVCLGSDRYLASRPPGGDRSPTNCMRRVRFPGSLPRSVSTVASAVA